MLLACPETTVRRWIQAVRRNVGSISRMLARFLYQIDAKALAVIEGSAVKLVGELIGLIAAAVVRKFRADPIDVSSFSFVSSLTSGCFLSPRLQVQLTNTSWRLVKF
jgi:hypothetical protein